MYQRVGMGWSDLPGAQRCDLVPNGEQRCFRTTTVDGRPPEQNFAASSGCLPLDVDCQTSPAGNPGLTWCCPPGWPIPPGAPPQEPGEMPPEPPMMSRARVFARRNKAMLGLTALAIGGVGYFFWRRREGY